MALQDAFQHRSARVIALSRSMLAFFFALAVSVEAAQPPPFQETIVVLLIAYMAFSFLVMRLIWNSWWLEVRLSPYAHIVDLVVFTSLVFLTEGYISPFFTFFVFLVLSAAIRWGWFEALVTTAVVVVLYLGASVSAAYSIAGPGFHLQRFLVRGANLAVLSFMIIWFGVNQSRARLRARTAETLPASDDMPPIFEAMRFALDRLRGSRVVSAWSESEEPWLNIWSEAEGRQERIRVGPDEFGTVVAERFERRPFLFDRPHHHVLLDRGKERFRSADDDAINISFADRFKLDSGIAIPLRGGGNEGWLFVLGSDGLCSDDLALALEVEEHVAAELARNALLVAHQEAASSRSRLVLARDLHDSVVQFLTGMAMKLRSMRRDLAVDDPMLAELDELEQQLAQEQRDLRTLLEALRAPSPSAGVLPIGEQLRLLAWRLGKQWGAQCSIRTAPDELTLQSSLYQQIELLIREAVANAVKHGSADKVDTSIEKADGIVRLVIEDDGRGFPESGEFDDSALREWSSSPRSIVERVHSMHGTVRLASSSGAGCRIDIALPVTEIAA